MLLVTSQQTAAASYELRLLMGLGFDRKVHGLRKLILILGWAGLNGNVTEPEACILLGRPGELRDYARQGYLQQFDLPIGLKSAPYFPHQHYFQLTTKGMMFVQRFLPHLAGYGNVPLSNKFYLHDHVARIEAAWRIRTLNCVSYMPECRLSQPAYEFQKRHDGILYTPLERPIGLELELEEWKSGNRFAMFVARCLNSITNDRVYYVLILVQGEAKRDHYAAPFQAGKTYCPEWVKRSGRWEARKSSETVITSELAARVRVDTILSKRDVEFMVRPRDPVWSNVAEEEAKAASVLYAAGMKSSKM